MALAEIDPGSTVLQTACVYGDFSPVLARHIGAEGSLEVVDVAQVQVDSCAEKLRDYPFASVRRLDVLNLGDGEYDTVCCYFLMHEVPDDYKRGVVDVVLNNIGPDGKVVFIDYHKPHWAHPLKPGYSRFCQRAGKIPLAQRIVLRRPLPEGSGDTGR
jgi:ubiquinone/menaquinone biosynthesis C-methylase UbiE